MTALGARDLNAASGVAPPPPYFLQDDYSGRRFLDGFWFWDQDDPTHGLVQYVGADEAKTAKLAVLGDNGENVLKVDHLAELPLGTPRRSVRIHSRKQYSSGLFILDVSHVPTGCATWPAFWLNGPDPWPTNGEVDVMESVNGNTLNQMTLHTGEGCYLKSPGVYSGSTLTTNCLSGTAESRGCAVLSNTNDTVGPGFNAAGGGVYALQFDDSGIRIWAWQRDYVPVDIWTDSPDPSFWAIPDAFYTSTGCTPYEHFRNMTVIFDITLCGDWAGDGTAWAASECPGSCAETVMSGLNFREAYFSIRSLRVFQSTANGSWADPPDNSPNYTTSGGTRRCAPPSFARVGLKGWSVRVGSLTLALGVVLAAWLCCAVQS